ncbi:MAG: hypothetical protein A2V85_03030 [Chloroflexi bacterium RBG_16_72_14]|nr:MAG: hypothetical protein A2V85_03030 [Chloroflexi bacterium RBG_16_72_14]
MIPELDDACRRDPGFPRCPANRPVLPRIRRRIGTYAEIRAFLLRRLDVEPALRGWTHRGSDDPGIALLEGAAILGDILTFYQELYANEAYLRTATWRESVGALVRLVGYRLAPGVGGRGVFALEVRGTEPLIVAAGFPLTAQVSGIEGPAEFQTTDALVAYPWLSRFALCRPLLTPEVAADTRELAIARGPADLELQPGQRLILGSGGSADSWGRAQVVVVDAVRERRGETLVTVRGNLRGVAPARELVGYRIGRTFRHFGHNAPPHWVTADANGNARNVAVEPTRSLGARTSATTDGRPSLGADEIPLDASVLDLTPGMVVVCQLTQPGRTVFDRAEYIDRTEFGAIQRQQAQTAEAFVNTAEAALDAARSAVGGIFGGTDGGASSGWAPAESLSRATLLVAEYRSPAGRVDLARVRYGRHANMTVVRTVDGVRQGSLTWGSLSGPSTILSLDVPMSDDAGGWANIADLTFHEATSPELRFRAAPVPSQDSSGNRLGFVGTGTEAATLAGRRLLLVPPSDAPTTVSVQAVEPAPGLASDRRALRMLRIDTPVDYADFGPEASPVVVHGNIVDATQGRLEREEAIGSGDARATFQTMPLPKTPLTYLTTPGSTPPEVPELDVYVAGRRWRRVASLFGAGPADEVYVVREDDGGASWVQFGDGRTGARLPSGADNVVARYRTGAGAFGPLRPQTSVAAATRLDRLDRIRLPGEVTGGERSETAASARVAAPGRIQALDRLVSLGDFEAEALAVAGVSRAKAAWRLVDNVPATVVTVLMDAGRETELDQVRRIVATADRRRGAARFPVIVVGGRRQCFGVDLRVAVDGTVHDADVVAAVRAALRVADGADEDGTADRGFGTDVHATTIEGLAQRVASVRWVRVDGLRRIAAAAAVASRLRSLPRLAGRAPVEVVSGFRFRGLEPFDLVERLAPRRPSRALPAGPDEILALRMEDLAVAIVAPQREADG